MKESPQHSVPGTNPLLSTRTGAALESQVERELIIKCRAGDARFYEPLVRAYEGPGLRVAVGMMGNLDDARDALQEAFVKVYHNLGRFDLRRPFGPWFYQILRNQCRDMLRSRASRFNVEELDEHLERRPADPELGPERRRERRAAPEPRGWAQTAPAPGGRDGRCPA